MIRKVLRGFLWFIIGSVVCLYSCSGVPVGEDVIEIVKQFEKDVGVKVEGTSIYYYPLNYPTIGRCFPGIKLIQLNTIFYKSANYLTKRALIYHELGHCVCNILIHVKDDSMFCGKSIMTKYMESELCLKTRWDMYVKDLRKRCK